MYHSIIIRKTHLYFDKFFFLFMRNLGFFETARDTCWSWSLVASRLIFFSSVSELINNVLHTHYSLHCCSFCGITLTRSNEYVLFEIYNNTILYQTHTLRSVAKMICVDRRRSTLRIVRITNTQPLTQIKCLKVRDKILNFDKK